MFDLLSVDDVVFVEVFECEQNVGRIESGVLEFESLTVTNVEVQLAPVTVIQNKVESLEVLEGVFKSHNERVLHSFENATLADCVLNLTVLSNVLLLEDLHCVVLICLLVQDEKDLAIGAFPEDLKLRKVLNTGLMGPTCLDLCNNVLIVLIALLERLLLLFLRHL